MPPEQVHLVDQSDFGIDGSRQKPETAVCSSAARHAASRLLRRLRHLRHGFRRPIVWPYTMSTNEVLEELRNYPILRQSFSESVVMASDDDNIRLWPLTHFTSQGKLSEHLGLSIIGGHNCTWYVLAAVKLRFGAHGAPVFHLHARAYGNKSPIQRDEYSRAHELLWKIAKAEPTATTTITTVFPTDETDPNFYDVAAVHVLVRLAGE
ncbi:hypothetical protein AC578_4122 [Pseudocercospora eumusae]|uniref:Uncharacterized protein n=1 Tax=Pseudocercospora eumusae TaxID=321146 RepID=A0A139HF65_9PEZI|nr:hypothetical protein AC578_4122 [Pseudocercospora eumusae]